MNNCPNSLIAQELMNLFCCMEGRQQEFYCGPEDALKPFEEFEHWMGVNPGKYAQILIANLMKRVVA